MSYSRQIKTSISKGIQFTYFLDKITTKQFNDYKFSNEQKNSMFNSNYKVFNYTGRENSKESFISLQKQLDHNKTNLIINFRESRMMRVLIAICLLIGLVTADIRIQNNELSAEGQWRMRYNPSSKNQVVNSNQNTSQQQSTTSKDSQALSDSQPDANDKETASQSKQQSQPNNQINIFQQFQGLSGSCFVFFYDSNLRDTFQNKQKVDSLSIRFHDPKYIDKKIIVLKISLQNYIIDTDDWQKSTSKVNYTYFNELQMQRHGSMTVSYKVGKGEIYLQIGECEIVVEYSRKEYSIVFPLVILVLCFLTLYAVVRFQKRQIAVQKVSIVTLYHTVFFFIYLSTFFLIIGMSALPQPMSLLLISGCLLILISVKLIRKFQTIIQRVSNINGYCLFYCGIFVYVWCLFNYYYTPVFIMVNSLFLLPQIVHNVKWGNRLGMEVEYLAILISPQLYFLYLKGYPDNVLRYHPQPWLCLGIIASVALQLWIVHNQNLKGPYFFIRKQWLPNYFNYYKTFKLDSKCELYELQCPICLCSLAQQDPITVDEMLKVSQAQTKSENKTQDEFSSENKIHHATEVKLMVTPCNHKFHSRCLEEWLQYKRECPVDRGALPILYK